MSEEKEKWSLIKILFSYLAISKIMKKEKWSLIKEMLFTYLALSKIMSWTNTINTVNQSGLGSVREAVVARLLNQDLVLIATVIFFFFLDNRIQMKKSKYSNILKDIVIYVIGFVGLVGIILLYNWMLSSPIPIASWGIFIRNLAPSYLVIIVVFEIKSHLKEKAKSLSFKNTDEKLSMLKALLNDGVLTQEEFDQKKDLVNIDG